MVGQGYLPFGFDAQPRQFGKETFGLGNGGGGDNAALFQVAFGQGFVRAVQAVNLPALQAAAAKQHVIRQRPIRLGAVGRAVGEQHGVYAFQAMQRLAQIAVGQQIQRPPHIGGREHGQLEIALQGVVLQAVVGNDDLHVGMRGQKRPARFGTAAAHGGGGAGAAVQQQRFVAGLRGGALVV